jgi:hypothetical protein
MYLAGRLLHRSAQSEYERDAALYIKGRLEQYTPDVSIEPFHAPENYPHLFASYMSEFLIVGALAIWWPEMAFGYGLGVFVLYMTEFCGYRGLSRFMPQYPSQNVTSRFLGLRPKSTILIVAYYDSGCATAMTAPERIRWLRPAHLFLVTCMVIAMATCAADAFAPANAVPHIASAVIRWAAVAALGAGALMLFLASSNGEDIRGANNNASGVAALLGIAERLKADPIEEADIWIVATGSHEAWMSGLRHFLSLHRFPKEHTYVLNLEGVGTGRLHYLKSEGFLYRLNADPAMTGIANALSAQRPIRAGNLRAIPTAGHVPLSRGMKAMSIVGLDRDGLLARWNQIEDRVTEVESTNIAEVIDCSRQLIRELAERHVAGEPG